MRRALTALLSLVLPLASCGPAALVPSVTPTATTSPITAVPTPSVPSASPSATVVAFPDLPFIIGTNAGDLYFQLVNGQPTGRKVHACEGSIVNLEASGRQALFLCYTAFPSTPTLMLYDDDTGTLTAIAKTESATYALTGTGQVVYVTIGTQNGTAPIPTTRLLLFDLRTGATTQLDDRYGVAFDVRLTGEGVMVWRPKNSLSFLRSDAETGTWILHGTTLTKLSQLRLIEGGNGRDLLESESVDPATGFSTESCCTYVVSKTTTEQRLTPADVRNEKGLALLEDGRIVTWRPENGEYDGSVVTYNGTTVERIERARFSAFRVLRTGDWIVAQEAAPTPALHAYRTSDGAFATMPGSGFSTFAFLGPKK